MLGACAPIDLRLSTRLSARPLPQRRLCADPEREQKEILEPVTDAVADTAPAVRELMKGLAGFKDTGKRMLAAWSEGVNVLRDRRMYALSPWKSPPAFEGISGPPKIKKPRTVIGRSELLARRAQYAGPAQR